MHRMHEQTHRFALPHLEAKTRAKNCGAKALQEIYGVRPLRVRPHLLGVGFVAFSTCLPRVEGLGFVTCGTACLAFHASKYMKPFATDLGHQGVQAVCCGMLWIWTPRYRRCAIGTAISNANYRKLQNNAAAHPASIHRVIPADRCHMQCERPVPKTSQTKAPSCSKHLSK